MTKQEKAVWLALGEVLDPELGVSITDMGLIYEVKVEETEAIITMTLTSPGCPLFGEIERDIKKRVKKVEGIDKVMINLVWEPVWSEERMTEEARVRVKFW
jgi:metal-sulfur cluster biosynthetic enzyme